MANLTLKSGYNVTLTEDPANGTLTISATDTKYTIDSTLSGSSTNPIQNKVVYTALAGKQDKLTAGTGISINGNTISCTVSGGSGGAASPSTRRSALHLRIPYRTRLCTRLLQVSRISSRRGRESR